jgi:hypothetical protein
MLQHEKINYLEFPAADLEATKAFFKKAFAWKFVDYGPEYTAFTEEQGMEGGFYKAELMAKTETGSALVVFYSENLDRTSAAITQAGGKIIKDIFSFPGGRRFHFAEPSGNEFAVWSDKL